LFTLLPNEDATVLLLDLPDRNRTERGRPGGFASAEIETGVMPGTTDTLAGDETLRERPVIMAAMGADRENLRARTHQQNLVVADVAEQRLAGEFGQAYTL
jgi:hypothetical protein